MLCTPALVGRVIGPRGQTIQEMQRKSGARIDVDDSHADPVYVNGYILEPYFSVNMLYTGTLFLREYVINEVINEVYSFFFFYFTQVY